MSRLWAALWMAVLAPVVLGQYAGSAQCRNCHASQFQSQQKTGHAQALAVATNGLGQWAFGAGAKATTYVSQVDRDTYAEHGLSYYAEKRGMALTPGHANSGDVRYRTFDPEATALRCFRCHSTGPLTVTAEHRIEPAEKGVHCEACHGAGGAHVRAGGSKATILNPGRLSAMEINELCGSCHRKPTEGEWTDPWKSRHQPSYLAQSACFRKSAGKLSCLTCHDPHAPLAVKAASNDSKCGSCHAGVRHRTALANKTCVECHMPQVATGLPIHFTNHWIGIYAAGKRLTPVAGLRRPLPPVARAAGFIPPSGASTLRPLFEQELAEKEKALSPEDAEVQRAASNLGLFLKNTGDLAGAEAALRRAHATAADRENLAIVLMENGKREEAAALFGEAAKGGDRAVASRSFASLAQLDPEHAERYYRAAVEASGKDDPQTAILLSNLALEVKARKDYAEAETLFRRALGIQERWVGADQPATAGTLSNLGSLLQTRGKLLEAERLERRALHIFEEKLGPFSAELATGCSNLADLLWAKGERTGAAELFRRAIAIDESVYGPGNPEVAVDLVNYGLLLKESGQAGAAAPSLRRALEIYERAAGVDSPQAVEVRKELKSLSR